MSLYSYPQASLNDRSLIVRLIKRRVMKREEYLTKKEQYDSVYSTGRPWVDELLSMRLMPNGLNFSRYGFVVNKRVGKAVVRNRVKRLLREIMRQTTLKPGWDIVFHARPAVAATGYNEIKKSMLSLLSRAQLLTENHEKVRSRTN